LLVSPFSFVDAPKLEAATGYPMRSDYMQPSDPDVLPAPNAIVVAPAIFNTINKWAAGISDTLALGLLTEAIGSACRWSHCRSSTPPKPSIPPSCEASTSSARQASRCCTNGTCWSCTSQARATNASRSSHGG
jgi:flavoprotein